MTLAEFASITRRSIRRDGIAGFIPTACFPLRREVRALAGLPAKVEPEPAVLKWAARLAGKGEEFLVAFKVAKNRVKIIRHVGADSESMDVKFKG